MKFPKIEKLPSGNYRMQIQIDGQRYSITDGSPTKVKQRAKELFTTAQDKRSHLTVGEAHDEYLKLKEPFLSPSTILGYRISRDNYLGSLMPRPVDFVTQQDIDLAIAEDLKRGISRKTLMNAATLLRSVLKIYRPSFRFEINLPAKEYHEVCIPTEEELKLIWQEMDSGKYNPELPIVVLLASWLGLRMSEILGLRFSDFDGDHVNITRAKVRGVSGTVEKAPKSYAGNRRIKVPHEILTRIEQISANREFVIGSHRSTINRQFHNLCENIMLPHYRIHDLRHFSASEALSLNIPDKYQMKRMGHSTDHMLRTVYQHVMRDKEDYFSDILDQRMGSLYLSAHADAHKKREQL